MKCFNQLNQRGPAIRDDLIYVRPPIAETFFLQANSDLDEVTINVAGTYKIEFTTLMQSTDQKLFRTEIFKVQYFCF